MTSGFLDSLPQTRIYPITDRSLSGRSHCDQVAELARRGMRLIQLREKDLSSGEFYGEAEKVMLVARTHGMKIIINDRVDIALAIRSDGVHLGKDDLTVEAARRLLGNDALIGYSTHNLAQAEKAAKTSIDYLAIGPIFPTTTKESTNPPVGLAGLTAVRRAVPGLPLVAIGGINAANRESIMSAGADAVAMIRDLWMS